MKTRMVQSRASTQVITFPRTVNQPHCFMKPIPLFTDSRQTALVSPVQQPFKQIPASESRRQREIPSPSKEIISNIDASVKRVKSAVVNRMTQAGLKRKDNGQYYGWLLKARLQPLVVHYKSPSPTIQECKGIVGCCRVPKQQQHTMFPSTLIHNPHLQSKSGNIGHRGKRSHGRVTVQRSVDIKKSTSRRETQIKSADNIIESIYKMPYKMPYKKETVRNSNNLAPIRMITVGKSSSVNAVLETKYKCFSAQFCGQYNVPAPHVTSRPIHNVLVPRYGMFNAEECYVYEHDAAVQNSKKPVVAPPRDSSSFNVELDFMLDKFDSEDEECSSHNDIQGIANKYCSGPGQIPGMVDWEEMVSNIADGALDMSGSRRKRREKKSTKLRSPIMFLEKRRETTTNSCRVKPSDLDNAPGGRSGSKSDDVTAPGGRSGNKSDDVTWYDVNSLRLRNE